MKVLAVKKVIKLEKGELLSFQKNVQPNGYNFLETLNMAGNGKIPGTKTKYGNKRGLNLLVFSDL